jgi:hypothetical protein
MLALHMAAMPKLTSSTMLPARPFHGYCGSHKPQLREKACSRLSLCPQHPSNARAATDDVFHECAANAATSVLRRDNNHGDVPIAHTVCDCASKPNHLLLPHCDSRALRACDEPNELLGRTNPVRPTMRCQELTHLLDLLRLHVTDLRTHGARRDWALTPALIGAEARWRRRRPVERLARLPDHNEGLPTRQPKLQ